MVYFDTSFLAPLFKLETTSIDVEHFIDGLPKRTIGPRAGDALHLAVATNNGVAAIYSFDRTMLKIGRALGLRMNKGFRDEQP